jgi:7-cyano-7-deazaguanine synthase in queuosine biosynthesis
MAKYLVPWSGGLDSTCLINDLLSKGHTVDALYTNINDCAQDTRQLNAVQAMTKEYFFRYKFTLKVDTIVGMGLGPVGVNSPIMLLQVPIHIFNLLKYIDNYDYVALAYVMNDDAVSFLDNIKKIYNSYQGISNKPLPKIAFPFSKKNKKMVFNMLPAELIQHITWCESSHEDNCGVCGSCKRMEGIYSKPQPEKEMQQKT